MSHKSTAPRATEIIWSEHSNWALPPQQERSRQTLRQILNAAVELFTTLGFDNTTVNDIAQAAGISAGSIYRRFPDKEAILYTVLDSYSRTRLDEFERILKSDHWQDLDSAAIIRRYVDLILDAYRYDTPLIRLYERRCQTDPHVREIITKNHQHVSEAIAKLLLPHRKSISHKNVKAAMAQLHTMLRGTLVLMIMPEEPPHWPGISIGSDDFKMALTQMALAFMGADR